MQRTTSDLSIDSDENINKSNRRLSLPATMHAGSPNLHFKSLPVLTSANRRHTVMPLRSILKSSGNDTVTLGSNRRVSFAGQVSVHKFKISNSPRRKSRNSLSTTITPVHVNVQEYMNRESSLNSIEDSQNEDSLPKSGKENIGKQTRMEKEIADLHAAKYQNDMGILEDNSTQTMEMSIELTKQIKEQQQDVKDQVDNYEQEQSEFEDNESFRELFEDFEEDDDKGSVENSADMELTEAFRPVVQNQGANTSANLVKDSNMMDLTEPITASLEAEEIDTIDMELTLPLSKTVDESKFESLNSELQVDDNSQTMDFTKQIQSPEEAFTLTTLETLDRNTLENKSAVVESSVETSTINDKVSEKSEGSNVRYNTPMRQIFSESPENETATDFLAARLSTVTEISEPANTSEFNAVCDSRPELGIQSTPSRLELRLHTITPSPAKRKDKENVESFTTNNAAQNTEAIAKMNSSGLDISFGTEIVPLAEVSDNSANSDNFESCDIFEDDYVNISMETFLRDINVQFYDKIGPSDREIQQTVEMDDVSQLLSGSIFSPSNTASLSVVPKSILNPNEQKRQTLLDYIDASNNIYYYHFLNHIISQYRASINTISNMVDKFANDVRESNLVTMREYYNQNAEVKSDLRTSYQAIANFTRKQSQNENMQFLSGLLEQLNASYDKSKDELNGVLESAFVWRKQVLLERQKMIEEKMELTKVIEKLQKTQNDWENVDIQKWMSISSKVKDLSKENDELQKNNNLILEQNKHIELELEEQKRKKNDLLKDINLMNDQIKFMEIPFDLEINQLGEQLQILESKASIKLIGKDPLLFQIKDDLQISFNNEKAHIQVIRMNNFKPFQGLVQSFVLHFTDKSQNKSPIEFMKTLKDEWLIFKNIWKDLAMLYYMYPISVNGNSMVMNLTSLGSAKGKLELKWSMNDLLDNSKTIPVNFYNVTDVTMIFEQLNQGIWGKLALVKRFIK